MQQGGKKSRGERVIDIRWSENQFFLRNEQPENRNKLVGVYETRRQHTLCQSCLSSCRLAQHTRARRANNHCLCVREDGGDGEATWMKKMSHMIFSRESSCKHTWALDVHKIRIWFWHNTFEFVDIGTWIDEIYGERLCGTQTSIKAIRTTNAPLWYLFVWWWGNKVWTAEFKSLPPEKTRARKTKDAFPRLLFSIAASPLVRATIYIVHVLQNFDQARFPFLFLLIFSLFLIAQPTRLYAFGPPNNLLHSDTSLSQTTTTQLSQQLPPLRFYISVAGR